MSIDDQANWRHGDARNHEKAGDRMPVPPLHGTNRVPSVIGVSRGSDGQGGSDLAQLRGDLEALEPRGRETNATRKLLRNPRVGCAEDSSPQSSPQRELYVTRGWLRGRPLTGFGRRRPNLPLPLERVKSGPAFEVAARCAKDSTREKFLAELWPLGTVVCGPLQAVRR